MKILFLLLPLFSIVSVVESCGQKHAEKTLNRKNYVPSANTQKAYFASGCFWCVEAIFESVIGIEEVISGYIGGDAESANYDAVSSGYSKHAESVCVYYDSTKISYKTLVEVFFGSHDASTLNRQGPDFGRQYRSSIFYNNENEKKIADDYIEKLYEDRTYQRGMITTEVVEFKEFFRAEDYHQDFEKRNPNQSYVKAVSVPRLLKFQKAYPQLLKKATKGH
ncbi:MAG: peptide methionine sulfoxide reductase MsrA 1 [Bacteroidota bacterium]|jgi:peptide-methionine (S)-S-oxide reductase